MKWHPNSNKHKSMHGGYRSRPAKKDVIATMEFYNVHNVTARIQPRKKWEGTQLRIEFETF